VQAKGGGGTARGQSPAESISRICRMVGQPRSEMMKNGAGVAYIPKLRAALRLKTFEAWPDAKSSVPVTGVKFGKTGLPATATYVAQAPKDAEHGSLVQERWRPNNRCIRFAVPPQRRKRIRVTSSATGLVTGVSTGKNEKMVVAASEARRPAKRDLRNSQS
jgi:hypothetical protein